MVSYCWVITKDHFADPKAPLGSNLNAFGMSGPGGTTDKDAARTLSKGEAFRMYDGDKNLVYEGKILIDREDMDVSLFEPLDDFGRPNFGCVGIKYQDENGVWEWL